MTSTTGLRETLEAAIESAIFDPGAEVGMRHDRTLSKWQTDAVMNILDRLRPSPNGSGEQVSDPAMEKLPMQDAIESILFRRSLEKRLDGYTLDTAHEIAVALSASMAGPVPEGGLSAQELSVRLLTWRQRLDAWAAGSPGLLDTGQLEDDLVRAAHALAAAPAPALPEDKPVAWPDFVAPPRYDNPAPGWTDPRLPDFRLIWQVAKEAGYAVGLHGSMKRDCDLIAVPWVEAYAAPEALIERLCTALNAKEVGAREPKPNGRIAVNLQIDGWFKLIDLSILS